ncbi:hypothetical protein ACA373_22070 [Erwinia sp. STN24]|uniref:Uncharacterized protein n=1 Tax=Klebsiella huaxiensis TaxID=2153354 RepID=A0ABT6EML1_9ENTR|nr:hypothetical protein [Klebsiella huaxiensis]MDG1646626.1 hypothetical protein [Klebsiella huaxiensis]
MISNEKKLIEFIESKYSCFSGTLSEISKNGENLFIDMDCTLIHLDKIPMLIDSGDVEANCFSVDTLVYCNEKDCLYLIEFKEGWPQGDSAKELRFKCYETMSKLIRNWSSNIGIRQDFFNLKIKYVVITRPPKKNVDENGEINKSFLSVLDASKGFFKLQVLNKTYVDDVRVFVEDEKIFRFLSRITNHHCMNYYHKGQLTRTEWKKDLYSGAISSSIRACS